MIVTLMAAELRSWLRGSTQNVCRPGGREVRSDVLDVALAVELVDVELRHAKLPGVIDRRGPGIAEGGMLGQGRDIALVTNDPVLARDGSDLKVTSGHEPPTAQ
jgi:hypothetical protein